VHELFYRQDNVDGGEKLRIAIPPYIDALPVGGHFQGNIVALNASVEIASDTTFTGAVFGGNVIVHQGSTVVFDPFPDAWESP
jgi:hypothetical protein